MAPPPAAPCCCHRTTATEADVAEIRPRQQKKN